MFNLRWIHPVVLSALYTRMFGGQLHQKRLYIYCKNIQFLKYLCYTFLSLLQSSDKMSTKTYKEEGHQPKKWSVTF
jgi:hypothetical protein